MKQCLFPAVGLLILLAGCTSAEQLSLEKMNEGKKAMTAGKFREAVALFGESIEYRSHNWMAYAECGDAYFFLEDYPMAVGCYDNTITIIHSMIQQYLRREKQENLSKPLVVGDLRRYRSVEADTLRKRATALMKMKKFTEAELSLRACIKVHPGHLQAWWMLANLYDENLKKPQSALNSFSWYLVHHAKASTKERQDYGVKKEQADYARERKRKLARQLNKDWKPPEKKKPGASELVCSTADDALRAEIEEVLTASAGSAGLEIVRENSGFKIEGGRETLEEMREEILSKFADRLDRVEIEIR